MSKNKPASINPSYLRVRMGISATELKDFVNASPAFRWLESLTIGNIYNTKSKEPFDISKCYVISGKSSVAEIPEFTNYTIISAYCNKDTSVVYYQVTYNSQLTPVLAITAGKEKIIAIGKGYLNGTATGGGNYGTSKLH